jgi:hypothetical protein
VYIKHQPLYFVILNVLINKPLKVLHGIRAYHRTNVVHTTYPVTKTRKNTGLHVGEGVEK